MIIITYIIIIIIIIPITTTTITSAPTSAPAGDILCYGLLVDVLKKLKTLFEVAIMNAYLPMVMNFSP